MSNKLSLITCIVIFLISAILITIFLAPGDILSNAPIYNDDYAMHFAQCISAKYFFLTYGKCWAYDPFYLAGFPNGALVNADNKAWELFYVLFSPLLGYGLGFKAYVIIFLLGYPYLIYGAARNFTLSKEQSFIAAFFAIPLCYLSLARIFIYCGMVSYVFALFLSMYALSLFYKLLGEFSWKSYISVIIVTSLLFLMHILSLMHIVIPMAVLYLLNFRKLSCRQHVLIIIIPILVLLFNSYWLIPMAQFFPYKTTDPKQWEFTFQIKNTLEPLKVYLDQRKTIDYNFPELSQLHNLNNTFIDVVLLLFGASGFYIWYKEKKYNLLIPLLSGVIFIFIIAFYGSHTDFIAQFQPERFTVALSLLCIIPASVGIFSAGNDLLRGKKALSILFILCLAFILLYRPVIKPFGIFLKYNYYGFNCTFPKQLKELLVFLDNTTTRDGRILLEDSEILSDHLIHEYYGGHLPALFPEYVRREYLCGPRPMYPIKHSYASFTQGVLLEKNIDAYTLTQLKKVCDVYNVKWIICWFQKSKKYFDQFPDYIVKLADIDKFAVYEVKRKPSFFIKGAGTVHADYNRLELSNIVAEDNEIIISYHWMEKLKTLPKGTIEKDFLEGDPVGFIKIKNPQQSLSIKNTY